MSHPVSSPEPPLSGYGQRGGLVVVSVVLAAAAVILCARAGPVAVAVPNASPSDVMACRRLIKALPATLGGQSSRPTTPPSALTAAWGRPPITLSCGQPPTPHPVADYMFSIGERAGGPTLTWFEDPFDDPLVTAVYSTRVRPILTMHVPYADSSDGVFGTVSDILLAQRGSG